MAGIGVDLQCPKCANKFVPTNIKHYIQCNVCSKHFHKRCSKLESNIYDDIMLKKLDWTCSLCESKAKQSKQPAPQSSQEAAMTVNDNVCKTYRKDITTLDEIVERSMGNGVMRIYVDVNYACEQCDYKSPVYRDIMIHTFVGRINKLTESKDP